MPTYNIKRNGWKNLHKNTRSTGSCYERKAADYLKQQGLFILRYNYRCRFGEIDLIARDGEYLVFVEVKYRKDNSSGYSLAAVNPAKQKTICKVARYFLTVEYHNVDIHAVSMWQELTGMKYTGLRMRLNILQSSNNYRNCFDEYSAIQQEGNNEI